MGSSLRFSMGENALKVMENIFPAQTLDELWESCLTELIEIEHTRKVEVLLFNERNDLVPVAEARQSRPRGKEKPVIRTQSWILESPVRHSTRKVKIPQVLPVLVVPLASADGMHGFMYIQWDRMPEVTPEWINDFHSLGLYLGAKVKEIALKKEVGRLRAEIEALVSYNKENIQNIASLSKDFYAFSAISTKINQSLDLDKALRKSMAKIKEVFKSSSVAAYVKNSITDRMELLVENPAEEPLLLFLRRSEKTLLKDIVRSGRHLMTDQSLPGLSEAAGLSGNDIFKKIIVVPMKSRERVLGALILLNRTDGVFTPESLRLLSGVASIMGMAVENMNLYRRSMQKKREGDFLVGSIAQFNKKLDLKKTLKSVVEKSTTFIEVHGHVFLFSETKFPLVESRYNIQGERRSFRSEAFKKIPDSELEAVYKAWADTDRPLLIRNLVRSRKLDSPLKDFFQKKGIHSLMVIPLRLMEKQVGLLLLGSLKGQRAFVRNDLEVASALGAAAGVAIENARAHLVSREMSEFLEMKIMEKTTQIEQIQERQKVQVENREDIVFRVNKANRFVFVNRAMEDTTGYSRE
ncbi:MAG TPA: GAF domain-containing protein, partial [Thermodesulfobacteriota bacterium]|nr:GAF domain-containing protein [Thermodesulfobacteriota bacterium]